MNTTNTLQEQQSERGIEMKAPSSFFVVGIGASAGGVQALQKFFSQVPQESGIAYVVILHLSPNHDSQLAEILQQETPMPVHQVTERMSIKADHVYVVPPDHHLAIEDEHIAVLKNMTIEDRRAPVDIFFRSLATAYEARAISVILSGTGANGSMGLKRIKELGGATFVQNPREAEYNEMPRNAIATDLIDEVLNVADLPRKIVSYCKGILNVHLPDEPDGTYEEIQNKALQTIFTKLKIRTGHDFSNYKRPTLLRRIERRISVHNLSDLPTYVAALVDNPEEINALLKDLLISVTNFFRDDQSFKYLETNVIPTLFANKSSQDQVRIWVAGCATGEEAYSLAMICAEYNQNHVNSPKVQIFATDIDETAISTAREGSYTINDAADVSQERLRRFFIPEGGLHRVKKDIREMVLFANHNFLKDPPFSKLDLVSCRNVLIYLNSTAQSRVIESFHFALKPKGFLFLGTSESVDGTSDLYSIYSRDHHIFITREIPARNYPVPDSVPKFQYSKTTPFSQQRPEVNNRSPRLSFGDLHQKMLEEYAPPSVVVNQAYDIVHMSEKAGKYFEFSGGEPTQNLLKLVPPQIRLELRAALFQAMQFKGPIELHNIKTIANGQPEVLDIHIRPALKDTDHAEGFILIIFKPSLEPNDEGILVVESNEPVAKHLEDELIGVKSQLRDSIEYHEYQAEELKASNEELQAMNEELRSAGEELETSKEELQSINEELRTVNQELKVKVEETSSSSNNLQNLINSASVGTIFVDRNFAIRLYTPAVLEIFNLKTGDYGRPITDITHNLRYDRLLDDAASVLDKLTIYEREVITHDNRSYMMRLLPYRTAEDRIGGVVITFFDITKRKEYETALKSSEAQMRMLIEGVKGYAIFMMDTNRHVMVWNSGAQLIFGYTESEMVGKLSDVIFTEEDRKNNAPEEEIIQCIETGVAEDERWHLRKDGSKFWGSGITQPIRKEDGDITGYVKILRDLTQQRELQDALKQSEERYRTELERNVDERTTELNESRDLLQSILDNSSIAMSVLKALEDSSGNLIDFEITLTNLELEKQTGRQDLIGKIYSQEYPGIKPSGLFDLMCRVFSSGKAEGLEYFYPYEGFYKWYSCMFVKMGDSLLATNIDVSERKETEEKVKDSEQRLRMFVTASSDLIFQMDAEWTQMLVFKSDVVLAGTEGPVDSWMDQYIPQKEQHSFREAIQDAIKNKKMFELEHQMRSADGVIGWASTRAIPMFDKNGDILEWFGVATDITDRKLIEQERNRNYLLLQQSEEVSGTGTFDYDLLTAEVTWSDGMYDLFQHPKDAPIGLNVFKSYATEDTLEIATSVIDRITSGTEVVEEIIKISLGEQLKDLRVTAMVIRNLEGLPLRVIGVVMDVTISRKAEARMRQLETQTQLEIFRATLSTQDEERRRISESLHNGLGQLLYGIKLSMANLRRQLLTLEPEKYEQAMRYTENLLTEAIRESRSISHELMPAALEQFGLPSAIDDVCRQLNGEVKFTCKYFGLDQRLESYLEIAIFRTVQELMLNVVKHSGADVAFVQVVADEEQILIKVKDNGKGIKDVKASDTGIGLTSIRSKIRLLNGKVKINSSEDAGTEVLVQIPRTGLSR
jgi:PAS domain S-box-containing protein